MNKEKRFHRTSINLYTEDVVYMKLMFERGWTEHIRDMIHQELKAIRNRIVLARMEKMK